MTRDTVYIVHHGARDGYQVARAVLEIPGMKVVVVTTGYPTDIWRNFFGWVPLQYFRKYFSRFKPELANAKIVGSFFSEVLVRILGRFFGEGWVLGALDAVMTKNFFRVFEAKKCVAIICYNYNAYRIFYREEVLDSRKILFMCHPHPLFCRDHLRDYMKAGLIPNVISEKEFSYSADYFARLIAEIPVADDIICASSLTKRSLMNYVQSGKNISVIPYGVGSKFGCGVNGRKYSDLGPLRVIFVGQFSYRKGINLVARIANMCNFPLEILFVGRGLKEYSPSSEEFNSMHNISIHWDVDGAELSSLYQNSDVFLFPTLLEGFGLVVLEAMRAGCVPLVSSNCCADDVIEHGVDGFVCEVERLELFAKALADLNADRYLLAQLGAKATIKGESFGWPEFRKGLRSSLNLNIIQEGFVAQPDLPTGDGAVT